MKRILMTLCAVWLLAAIRAGAQVPSILSEPASLTVNAGSAGVFTVTASNAFTYQWVFNATNALQTETNASLTLDNIGTNQAGSYTVTVTSSNSLSVTSSPAILTVLPGTLVQLTISTYAGGSSSNVQIELFNHDKPATVENFIHYISSGVYSNVFFDRDVANDVLQGGDQAARNRLTNVLNFSPLSAGTNLFPSQLASEFGVGPFVRNEFGTLAMYLPSKSTNSATSTFLFNLADNTNNDASNYTVFGRVVSGTNILQFFNTLTPPSNGIYDLRATLPTIPVDYDGTNAPNNTNLFYVDFSFLTPTPIDTNAPSIVMTFPTSGEVFTNGFKLTAQGTAQDNVGLAEVYGVLTTLVGAGQGTVQTNIALGTSNWSLNLGAIAPGVYTLAAYAQDGAGNLSVPQIDYLTNLATLTIITNLNGKFTTNAPLYLIPGQSYSFTAQPSSGAIFDNWQNQGVVSVNPVESVTMESNLIVTVSFVSNDLPAGFSITSPAPGSSTPTANATLTITGTLPSADTITQLTGQLFSQSNAVTSALGANISGTNWSLVVSNLVGGPYTLEVVAVDSAGNQQLLTENFTALVPPVILTQPSNQIVNAGSSARFSVTANYAATYQWELVGAGPLAGETNATLDFENVTTNQSGTYEVVLTSHDAELVTSSPVVLTVLQGTILQLTLSSYADGSSSNLQIELFDHDKPAMAENFIHYIMAGAYSNMFFDRDVAGFVLQGGDDIARDRLNNGLYYKSITPGPGFPSQVDSEFSVGPLIHNTFGTMAMALGDNSNSASSAFFFNLADNSANLDSQNGGFTVFGRILSGSNILAYFNTLSAPSNGIYDLNSTISTLPVNYNSTNTPTDANLFFGDFSFVTSPPVDTNAPTVTITYPAPNASFITGGDLTVLGTASDDVGLADVFCVLTALTGMDAGQSETNAAEGTASWSLDLGTNAAGVYELAAYAQDGAGNLSAPIMQYFTNLAALTIVTNVNGQLTTNAPVYLNAGQQYSFTAEAGAGETFDHWATQGQTSINPVETITAESNLTLTVTFVSNNLPSGLTITQPAAGSEVPMTNGFLTIAGTLPSSDSVTQLTCQIFSQYTPVTAALSATVSGTNWSLAESNLSGGLYTLQVLAKDSSGLEELLTENFTALVAPTILSGPSNITVNAGSTATFTVLASNVVAYQWVFDGTNVLQSETNASLTLDNVATNQAGSYTVVVTSSNSLPLTSSPAILTVSPGTLVQLTISTYAGGGSSNVQIELFNHDKPATVENFIHYISSGVYSNVFFDRDVANDVLQGGDQAARNRLTNVLNFSPLSAGTNLFPSQLASEFGVGPFVRNEFGTLAMYLPSKSTNSATSTFLFNLADNTNNDASNYTVFGRVVSGTNILQFFNTLTPPSNGIYDLRATLPTIPVNDDGTNAPNNTNLFYADFSFLTPPPIDTNPPSVVMTFPTSGEVFTNGFKLTAQGTAQDNVGLAEVYGVLTTLVGAGQGSVQTNIAPGTSNWSLNLGAIAPGVYTLAAYAQDGAGNLSVPQIDYLTNLATLTIITNLNGKFTTNAPLYLIPGQSYSFTAQPSNGAIFDNWQNQGVVSVNPVESVTMESNLIVTVSFVSNDLPAGFSITSPAPGSSTPTANATLTITGTLPSADTITQLTGQLFSQSNAVTPALGANISGTNWSLVVSNLVGGPYTLEVVAVDSTGNQQLLIENFTALVPPVILAQPSNQMVNAGSSAQFSVTANYAASYQWELVGVGLLAGETNAALDLENVTSNMSSNAYEVTLTSHDGQTVTSSPAVLTVLQGTILQLTLSSYADGSLSNLQIELFDHDKPATVENFIHYITAGAYSNMFFDRDAAGFVLQGGDDIARDRLTNGLYYKSITPGPGFPSQVDSEFSVGPLIHNTCGTMAMALGDNSNSAASAFFFNLADNSTNLDSQNGGFTVFGRILNGSNVLAYFNTLSAPSNGIYDLSSTITTLPVNYNGTNAPTDANLFFGDFSFVTSPPVDTNAPTVAITYPAPNASFITGGDLTALGRASDNAGLAEVFCTLRILTGPYAGQSQTNAATGTTDWSLDLQTNSAGVYELAAYAQDGAGNLSEPVTQFFTNLATLTILTNVNGQLSTNAPLFVVPGQSYSFTAQPGPGEVFENWQNQGQFSADPLETITTDTDLVVTVVFVSNDLPAGLAITSPAANSTVPTTNATLNITGTLPSSDTVTQLTCQLFTNEAPVTSALPATLSGTNWSLVLSNLAGGPYTLTVLAKDSNGLEELLSESFTAQVPPVILAQPSSVTVNTGSSAQFSVTANYAASYQWELVGTGALPAETNTTLDLENVSSNMSGNFYEVVVTAHDGETLTSKAALLTVVPGTLVQMTISKYADGSQSNLIVELFDHDKPATVQNFIHGIASGSYSNTFFDTDATNFFLQGGNFVTPNRTNNPLKTALLSLGTNFPSQVDNEFGVGPVIHNAFGTLGMSEGSGTNSSSSSFYFNLKDNSSILDSQYYTVFGRVVSDTNVLAYFNTLFAPSNGIVDYTNFNLSTLPVNDDTTNAPNNANLFYCDFSFLTTPVVGTNPPAITIASPAPNSLFSNVGTLTVEGMAQDNVAVAEVFCVVTALSGSTANSVQTNIAVGGANWQANIPVPPGVYQLNAYAQDGAGNLSAPATLYFTNLAELTVATNFNGQTTNSSPTYLLPGQQYSATAHPTAGQIFYEWQYPGTVSINPIQTLTVETNITLTVTYISSNIAGALVITNPAAGSVVQTSNRALTIGGMATSELTGGRVICQLFSQSNAVTSTQTASLTNTNWSVTFSSLTGGPYTLTALAQGPSNLFDFVSENFTALIAPPGIVLQPVSVTANVGSSANFSMSATNVVGYQWELAGSGPIAGATGSSLALNDLSLAMSGSSYDVILTAPDGETRTSSAASLTVIQGTLVQLTISAFPAGSSSSNLQIELFDHDKPATVQNFIHDVSSGIISNTFFDTLGPGVYLQGGTYRTANRSTNDFAPENISTGTNLFPLRVASEFGIGPLIPNTFGTLAALQSGAPSAVPSSFFFNLGDNSASLDNPADGYTVFGRVITGTNVLLYFNALNAPSNGIIDESNYSLTALPVNYNGTNAPQNDNLFYSDFSFLTVPSVDTTPPTVAITNPAPSLFTNGAQISLQGTAQDNLGLADVLCVLLSSTGAYGNASQTNIAQGTTNWSFNLGTVAPGIFELNAYAQDGAGNLSAPVTEHFTNLATLTIVSNINGQLTTNSPRYLVPGQSFTAMAETIAGQQFVDWSENGVTSINPVKSIVINGNATLTATYSPSNTSSDIEFTSPVSGAQAYAVQTALSVSGTIASSNFNHLTCQVFVDSTAVSSALPANVAGTNWSLTISNLPNGNYTMEAIATNEQGDTLFASEPFSLLNVELLTVNISGGGTVLSNPAPYAVPGFYTLKAVPNKGQAFYSWTDGANITLNPSEKIDLASNLTLTATFVQEDTALAGISITYPTANAFLTNGTFNVTGKLPASPPVSNLTCQLFLQSNAITALPQEAVISSKTKTWSLAVSNLIPGPYTIMAVGYETNGNARLVSQNFNLEAKFSVKVQPTNYGAVTAGLNGSYLQVGKTYSITATPKKAGEIFGYWSGAVADATSATTTFVMSNNLSLTANFVTNPFPPVAGVYTGLFLYSNYVSATNAGFISITVGSTGAVTGDLTFPAAAPYPINWQFSYSGNIDLSANGLVKSNTLNLIFNLDLTNGTDSVTGYVSDTTSGNALVWLSPLTLYRAVTGLAYSNAPAPGHYVILMQPDGVTNESIGNGYAAVQLLSTGSAVMSGTLPDNTTVTETAKISTNGIWPVYIVPSAYKQKGLVIGWLTNSHAGQCAGALYWVKPPLSGAYYTNGLDAALDVYGSAFVGPKPGTNYEIVFGGGALTNMVTNVLSFKPSGSSYIAMPASNTTDRLSATLISTGVFSAGSVSNAATKKIMTFSGAFVSPSEGGGGFTKDVGTQTGFFFITTNATGSP